MSHRRPEREGPISVPRSFFDQHLGRIRDLAALKVLLVLYQLVATLEATEPYVAEAALFADRTLLDGLRWEATTRAPVEEIERGIDLLAAHEAVIRISVEEQGECTYWLMPNEPENMQLLNRVIHNEVPFPRRAAPTNFQPRVAIERPNIFRLYEQNIGMLTPLIADHLIEAIELYPERWIEDAIGEAVSLNRRNWRYIQRILQRWETEGRRDETDRRNQGISGFVQREKYLRGKYSSLFHRGD